MSVTKSPSYVLLVMANPLASQILLRLSSSGYATMRTQTAEAALKLQHRYHPVLTILDASLPDVDAAAFCQAMQHSSPYEGRVQTGVHTRNGLLVILPSGQDEQIEKLLDLGADDVISAPVSVRMLTHRLKQLIEIQTTPQPFEYQQQFLHWMEQPALICDHEGMVLTVNPALSRLCGTSADILEDKTLQSLLRDGEPGNGRAIIQSRIAQAEELSPFFKDQTRIERRVSLWRQGQPALTTTLTLRPIDQGHYLATFAPMPYTNPKTSATATSTQTQTVVAVSATDTSELNVTEDATTTSQMAAINAHDTPTETTHQVEDEEAVFPSYETGDLFDDANDAILIVDIASGTILNANRLACRWLEYNIEELNVLSIDNIEVPLNPDQQRQIQEMMSTTGQLVYEHSYRTKSGSLIPVEVSSRIIQYNGHNAFLCFARDITRRRQTEEAERMQRSLAEALRASVSVLNNSLDFNDVIEKMLELIDYVVPSDAANVMRIEGTQAQVIAHRGYELYNIISTRSNPAAGQGGVAIPGNVMMAQEIDDHNLALKTQTRLRDLPFTDWMHRHKLPIYISNTQELRQYRAENIPAQPEFRSMVGAPIIVENNVIGFIHLESRMPNQFSDEDAGRLMAFADQAGIALRNAQLFHRMQNHAEELELRVDERTSQLTRANHVLQDQMAERRKFEYALAEERNLLRTIIDTLPDEVYVKDRNGRIVLQNVAASNHRDDRPVNGNGNGNGNGSNGYHGINGGSTRQTGFKAIQAMTSKPETPAPQTSQDSEDPEGSTKPGGVRATDVTPPADDAIRDTQLIRIIPDLTDQERSVIEKGVSYLDQERMWFDSQGRQHWMLSTRVPLYDDSHEITGLVAVRRDISALRGAEEGLAQVVTGANCLLWSAYVENVDGKLKWDFHISSEEAAQHFLPVAQKEGQSYASAFLASVPPGDRKQREEISQVAILGDHSEYLTEYRSRRADGDTRWLSEAVRIRPIQPGRWSLVGVCTDVTERNRVAQELQDSYEQLEARVLERTQELTQANVTLKQQMAERQRAEQALRESETRFRALVENAPEAIVVFDVIHERYTSVNQNAVKLFGTKREDLLRKGPLDHCREYQPNGAKSSVLMRKYIQDALHGRTPVFEWEYIGAEGTPIPCEVRLLLLRDANSYLIRGSITDISERLRAQAALRESEQKYRSLTQQLPVGVFRALQDGKVQFANPAMAHILGFENPDELIGLSIYDFFLMEDGPLSDGFVVKDLFPLDRSVIQIEHRVRQKDGKIIWVRDTGHIILDSNDDIAYADYISEDITDRVNMEQAERKQRLLAEALKAAAEDLSRSLDLESIFAQMLRHVSRVIPTFREATVAILESDQRYLRSFHFTADHQNELTNQMLQIKVDPKDWPIMNKVLTDATPIVIPDVHEYEGWLAVESHDWVRSYLVTPIMVDDKTIGVINLSSDQPHAFDVESSDWLVAFSNQLGIAVHNAHLYEAVQIEKEALQQTVEERTAELNIEQTRLRAILDAMNEGVVFHDDNGQVLYSNRSLTYLLGYKINEIQFPQIWDEIYVGPDEEALLFKEKYRYEIGSSGNYSTRLKLRHRDNYEFDASIVTNRVENVEGQSIGNVIVIRDVSAETRLEQQKKSFISSASHELRTPLTNLKTRLYLIRQDPTRLDEHLLVLETVTNRMRRLVEDLFDISRFENGVMTMQRELRELQPILFEIARLQRPEADKAGITLEIDVPDAPARIMVDEPRLVQVMTNLLTNALNHTPSSGRIRIDATLDRRTEGVIIGVSDTGTGISEELLGQIFKPFVRGKDDMKGAGLGLSISKEIIDQHGGHINVTSEVGRGTRFEVWLPLYDEQSSDSK